MPNALDARVLAVVVGAAALAASLNVPYGGQLAAVAAFVVLAAAGVVGHLVGERRLRRLTGDLVERWADAGGRIEDVTRSSAGLRTEWTVRTPEGPVTVGGLALAPISRLSVEWRGTGDAFPAAEVEADLDRFAEQWHAEIFDLQ